MGLYNRARATKDTAGGAAGSGSAAQVDAPVSTTFAVFYDVDASTADIKIEGRTDNGTWRELDETVASGSITTGGDVVAVSTAYEEVRAYAGSSFADGDVNEIEVAAKGT
jgi:hypothetical protein